MQPNKILRNNLQEIQNSVKLSFKYILGKKPAIKSVQSQGNKSITEPLRKYTAITEESPDLRVSCTPCPLCKSLSRSIFGEEKSKELYQTEVSMENMSEKILRHNHNWPCSSKTSEEVYIYNCRPTNYQIQAKIQVRLRANVSMNFYQWQNMREQENIRELQVSWYNE